MALHFEYQGKHYEFEDGTTPDVAKSKILAHLGEAPASKRKTGVMEDVGIGLTSLGHTAKTALDLVAGGVAGLAGFEEDRDKIFDDMVARSKARNKELSGLDQGTSGKIISGVAGVAPMLAAAPLGVPLLAMGGGLAGMGALENTAEDIMAGADMSGAKGVMKTMADAGLNTAALALPGGKGLVKGAGWGAGGNLVSQAGTDIIGQATTDGEAAQRYGFDPEKYGIAAAVGGLVGGGVGHMTRNAPDAPTQPPSPDKVLPPSADAATAAIKQSAETRLAIIKPQIEEKMKFLKSLEASAEGRGLTDNQLEAYNKVKAHIEKLQQEASKPLAIIKDIEDKATIAAAKAATEADNLPRVNDGTEPPIEAYSQESPQNAPESIPDHSKPLPPYPDQTNATESDLGPSSGIPERGTEPLTKVEVERRAEQQPLEDILSNTLRDIDLRLSQVTPETVAKSRIDLANDPLNRTEPTLIKALQEGGIVGGLHHVVDTNPDTPLSKIAEAILNNRNIRPDVWVDATKEADIVNGTLAKAEFDGSATPKGRVTLWGRGQNAITLVHEALHSATARQFKAFRNAIERVGMRNDEKKAVEGLIKLYDKIAPDLPARFKVFAKDPEELISHGLTEPDFMTYLGSMKYSGGTAKSSMIDGIARMLGFKGAEKTALKELLGHTETLVGNSIGGGFKGKPLASKIGTQDFNELMNLNRSTTPEKLLEMSGLTDIPNGFSNRFAKFTQQWFGDQQFIEIIKRDAPVVFAAYKEINRISQEAIRQKRVWLNGDAAAMAAKGFAGFRKLTHYEDKNSVGYLWPKAKWQDSEAVFEVFKKGYDEGADYVDNLNKNGSHLSDQQKAMYDSAAKMFEQMALDAGIKRPRKGWYPAVRKGDHVVTVRTKDGHAFHLETFRTKAEADIFVRNAKNTSDFVTDYMDKRNQPKLLESFQQMQDMLTNSIDNAKAGTPEHDRAIRQLRDLQDMQQDLALKAGLGKHDVHRQGMSGAAGERWFKNREQNAKDFQQAIFDSVNEYSSLYRNRGISQSVQKYAFNKDLQAKFPNQTELVKRMGDNAINEHSDLLPDKQFKEWIDNGIVKMIDNLNQTHGWDLGMPKLSLVDRTHGLAAQMFYISALTTRPAFWAAQLMSSPFSVRQMLKDSADINGQMFKGTLLDTVKAQGKGMLNITTGGDQAFREFIKRLANETDSLHPQFINDINSFGKQFLSNGKHATFKHIFEWGTGQAPGAMADSASRYMTAATAYELYKPHFKGDINGLMRQVSEFTDKTMVMYSREHTPPILQRLGTAGQMIAPLQKYATAQLGMLISDLKYIKDKKTLASTLPLLSTMMTSMVMGGTFGAAMAAEYEILRSAVGFILDKLGMTDRFDEIAPPLEKLILSNNDFATKALSSTYEALGASEERALAMAQYGVPSGAVGMDIGSGLRFQPFISKVLTDENSSLLDGFPAVKFAKDVLVATGKATAHELGGRVGDAEYRKAVTSIQPFVGYKAAADRALFDSGNREFVPQVSKEGITSAKTEQTGQEELATLLGTSVIGTKNEQQALYLDRVTEAKISKYIEKSVDLAIDKFERGESPDLEDIVDKAMQIGGDTSSVLEKLKTAIMRRNIPAETMWKVGADGSISTKELMRMLRMDEMQQ